MTPEELRELQLESEAPSRMEEFALASARLSLRGNVLVLEPRRTPCDVPLVCVEMAGKWYTLFVLHVDGHLVEHDFGVLEPHRKSGCCYIDHTPYPPAVTAWARFMGYYVDDLSLEMMVGRWITEGYRLDDDLD